MLHLDTVKRSLSEFEKIRQWQEEKGFADNRFTRFALSVFYVLVIGYSTMNIPGLSEMYSAV